MTATYLRTLPQLGDMNRSFWTSGADGVLRISRCKSCGYWIHPPGPICPKCLSDKVEVEAVSGKATVETFTINYRAWGAGLEVPYTIAIVVLDEQLDLRLTTNILGIEAEKVTIGLRVQVTFEQDEDVWLPMFIPLKTEAVT
jgi:uncharacterized OB-fold protein